MDVLESITKVFKSMVDDDPKPPLHVGEVMALWTYLVALREAVAIEQSCINMTENQELISALEEGIHLCTGQAEQIERFFIDEGVPLPPVSSTKPKTAPDAVPTGAKLTEDEIANTMSIKIASAIVTCAMGQSESIRNDVGAMWIRFQMEQVTFGGNLKAIMRKRGWIKVPPFYTAPGVGS